MKRPVTYTIREEFTTYSRKKGSFVKTKTLYRGIDQTLLNELLVTEFKDLKFSTRDEFTKIASKPGLLYPGKVTIIQIGGKPKTTKDLMLFNGRGHGIFQGYHLSVAAYSRAEARRLIEKACDCNIGSKEVKEYYSPCWGDRIQKAVNPPRYGVWVEIQGTIIQLINKDGFDMYPNREAKKRIINTTVMVNLPK